MARICEWIPLSTCGNSDDYCISKSFDKNGRRIRTHFEYTILTLLKHTTAKLPTHITVYSQQTFYIPQNSRSVFHFVLLASFQILYHFTISFHTCWGAAPATCMSARSMTFSVCVHEPLMNPGIIRGIIQTCTARACQLKDNLDNGKAMWKMGGLW